MCVFERCLDGCKQKPGHLVLPDSLDERALSAAARLKAEGLAEPLLIGNPMALRAAASSRAPSSTRRRAIPVIPIRLAGAAVLIGRRSPLDGATLA